MTKNVYIRSSFEDFRIPSSQTRFVGTLSFRHYDDLSLQRGSSRVLVSRIECDLSLFFRIEFVVCLILFNVFVWMVVYWSVAQYFIGFAYNIIKTATVCSLLFIRFLVINRQIIAPNENLMCRHCAKVRSRFFGCVIFGLYGISYIELIL